MVRTNTAVPPRTIEDAVLKVLAAAVCDGSLLYLPGSREKAYMDRTLYVRTNAVIEALGGKWDKHAKGHVFSGNAHERISDALATGTYARPEDYGFFETPRDLAEALVRRARIEPGMAVLEPSAGRGALAAAVARLCRIQPSAIDVIELQDDLAANLIADGYRVIGRDFMDHRQAQAYDRIVMNPPFAKGQDARHVTRAYACLKPGGRLVAITSAGVVFRNDGTYPGLRTLIERRGTLTPNPDGSFAPATDVRTVTVILEAES